MIIRLSKYFWGISLGAYGGGSQLQAVCTRWGSDPMAYGSYSSLTVGSLGGEVSTAAAWPSSLTAFT